MQRFQKLTVGLMAGGTALALLMAAPVPGQTTRPETRPATTQDDLPTAEKVIEQYIEAVGGEEEYRNHKSLMVRGTLEMRGQNVEGPFTIKQMAPDKSYMELSMGGIEARQGYNGEVGWSLDTMSGAMLLEGEMLEDMRREADFYRLLNYAKLYEEMEVVEKTTFNDRDVYKLRLVKPSGRESSQYFDVETHLLIGEESMAETPMGLMPVTTKISDYRDVDGVLLPHTMVQVLPVGEHHLRTEEAVWDTVEESAFELPQEIKTLLEGRKKPTTQPGDDDSDEDDDGDDEEDDDDEGGGGDG